MRPITTKVYLDGGKTVVVRENAAAKARREMTLDLRTRVIRRDRGMCRYCACKPKVIEIDHVFPVTYGGQSTMSNCVTACRSCNQLKGWSKNWVPIPLEKMPRVPWNLQPKKRTKAQQRQAIKKKTRVESPEWQAQMAKRAERFGDDRVFRYTGK